MAKKRPECLIIGDKMTFGRSRKPGSCWLGCVPFVADKAPIANVDGIWPMNKIGKLG
jgi:hypothetical protein